MEYIYATVPQGIAPAVLYGWLALWGLVLIFGIVCSVRRGETILFTIFVCLAFSMVYVIVSGPIVAALSPWVFEKYRTDIEDQWKTQYITMVGIRPYDAYLNGKSEAEEMFQITFSNGQTVLAEKYSTLYKRLEESDFRNIKMVSEDGNTWRLPYSSGGTENSA